MKHLRHPAMVYNPLGIGLLFGLSIVAIAGMAFGSAAAVMAQTPGVHITELRCNEDPEVVAITNQGTAGQDLTGWTLRSDPVGTEQFDLTPIGVLAAGATVFVQSGPAASGSFVWSQTLLFRDGASNDFARIVDSAGAVVHEVNCAGGSPTPTPTPPSSSPSPSPTSPPATEIIDGGGPPGGSGLGRITPILTLAVGGLFLVMGSGSLMALRPQPSTGRSVALTAESRNVARRQTGGRLEALILFASLSLMILIVRLITSRRR